MIARYLELAERIRGEAPELERVTGRAVAAWAQVERMPQEDAYLDSVALNLHSFYSGLERLFELVARHVDGAVPTGDTWHRDLLQRMTQDLPQVRPALIGRDHAAALDEFRRFRHLVRNVYTMNLTPDRVAALISKLPPLWSGLRRELLAFADFLEALGQAADSEE
jgi:hypothetical protein